MPVAPTSDAAPRPGPVAMPHARQLDGLRAIAILLVVAAHTGLEHVVPGGFGVTLFFFLSGYLITTLLRFERMATGTIGLRDFYLRRVLRIMPPLYLTLAFAGALYGAGLLTQPVDGFGVVNQAAFLTNYGDLYGPNRGLPLPLWSLAVEEHFYILFPLAFLLWLGRIDSRRAAAWCGALCVLVLAGRIVNVAVLADWSHNYSWTHTRIDSILFGCCLALWNNPLVDRDAFRPDWRHVAAAFAVLLLCLAIRDEVFRQTVRYTLQGGALFVLFSAALQSKGPARRALASPVLARIALYSYTIYLVHPVFFELRLPESWHLPHVARILLALALIWLYAEAMYRLVERPAAALRRRLHRRRPEAEIPVSPVPAMR